MRQAHIVVNELMEDDHTGVMEPFCDVIQPEEIPGAITHRQLNQQPQFKCRMCDHKCSTVTQMVKHIQWVR